MKDKERKQRIFDMYAEGHTYAEIGREFGVSRQRIQQIVRPPITVLNALRRRAGDKCERCRIELRIGDAHVHHADKHITGNYEDLKRVRLLCRSCHKIEDWNQKQAYRKVVKGIKRPRGMGLSEEHKRKISEANVRSWERRRKIAQSKEAVVS